MFCGNCGCKLEEGSVFCGNCGAKVENPVAETPAAPVQEAPVSPAPQNPNNKNKTIGIVAVCVAAALVLSLIGFLVIPAVFGGSAEKRAVKFLEAYFDGDAKETLSYVHDDVIKAAADDWDMTRREFIDMMQEELDEEMEYLDDEYDRWSVSFEVEDTEEFKRRDVRDLQEYYDELDCDVEIKEAMEVEIEMTARYDGERERETAYVTMVKIGSKWYVCPFSTDMF